MAQTCLGKLWPYDSAVCAKFSDSDAQIYAWPSRGSVIVLNSAEAMDFEFLGLDPLDPPVEHLDDQVAEDAFCQRLLLTGAKRWDSEARYSEVAQLEVSAMGDTRRVDNAFRIDKQPRLQCARSALSRSAGRQRGACGSLSSTQRSGA